MTQQAKLTVFLQKQSIFDLLNDQKVAVYIKLLGDEKKIVGKVISYNKPFVRLLVEKHERIFNEFSIHEVIPLENQHPETIE